jgi:hypothetical protein
VLSQPAPALTDLALAIVTLNLAVAAGRVGVARSWRRTLWWAGVAALAGAVHHGFVTFSPRWSGPSWALISGMVVVTISFSLAASVQDVLGPGRRRAFWVLRLLSLGAYAGLALFGHYGVGTILACEGLTMATILVLWCLALSRGHPRAPAMLVALAACVAAGCVRALPSHLMPVGLDAISLYHLAQVPGMVLLYLAVTGPARQRHLSGLAMATDARAVEGPTA